MTYVESGKSVVKLVRVHCSQIPLRQYCQNMSLPKIVQSFKNLASSGERVEVIFLTGVTCGVTQNTPLLLSRNNQYKLQLRTTTKCLLLRTFKVGNDSSMESTNRIFAFVLRRRFGPKWFNDQFNPFQCVTKTNPVLNLFESIAIWYKVSITCESPCKE